MNEDQDAQAAFGALVGADDPDALRALGHAAMRYMAKAFVAGVIVGAVAVWLLFV